MKKLYLILAMCVATSALAQNSFPASNAIWNMHIQIRYVYGFDMPGNCNLLYRLDGDTIMNEIMYNKLYISNKFSGVIREDNQKVWFKMGTDEYLLYDFGASVGDTVWHNLVFDNSEIYELPYPGFGYSIIQNITISNGIKHLYTRTNLGDYNVWIEGMGSDNGLFGHLPMHRCLCEEYWVYSLGCFKYNDEIKYISCECNSCFYCPYSLPLEVRILCEDDYGSYYGPSDTIYFNYQTKPIDVKLLARPLTPYHGTPPFKYLWTTNSEIYTVIDNTLENPTFSFKGTVTVNLKVTDVCSCNPAYDKLTLSMLPLDVNEVALNNIFIYPNPTKDILNITIPENIAIKSLTIYSMDGKLMDKNKYSFNSNQLNISRLVTGNYIIEIETDKGNFNQIFIKN